MNVVPKLHSCSLCGFEGSTDKQIRRGRCVNMVACHRRWKNAQETAKMRHNLAHSEGEPELADMVAPPCRFCGSVERCGHDDDYEPERDKYGL